MKTVYRFNQATGEFIEPVILQDGENPPVDCTTKPLPQPNWKPLFKNGTWVETATEEEKTLPEPELSPLEKQVQLIQTALDDLILGGGF